MISVAMATYNGEKFLLKQLDSICNQSMDVDEIVIFDDCSTDHTFQLLESYVNEHSHMNIKLFKNKKNVGYCKNFYNALAMCKGDYIFLADQDDIWEKNKVEAMISILNTNGNIQVLASSFTLIDKNDELIQIRQVPEFSNNNLFRRYVKQGDVTEVTFDELCIQNYFQGCALVMKKNIRNRFLESFTDLLFHDWLINLLASEQQSMYFYNEALFKYRIHDNNAIGIKDETNKSEETNRGTLSEYYRTYSAKQSINTLNILLDCDKSLLKYQKDAIQKREFYTNHILYLNDGKIIPLFFQNFNKYYKNIKSYKARLSDLYYCFWRKFY